MSYDVLVLVAAFGAVSGACGSTEYPPLVRRGQDPVTLSSGPVLVVGDAGGTVAVDGARLVLAPGALTLDATLTLTLSAAPDFAAGGVRRTVVITPAELTFATPATLAMDLLAVEADAAAGYEATADGEPRTVAVVADALVVELRTTGVVTVGDSACLGACDEAEVCYGGRCLDACGADADCPTTTRCANGFTASVVTHRRCDGATEACVTDTVELHGCDRACVFESGACAAPAQCTPPHRAWGGPRGLCLCGFPELSCRAPAWQERSTPREDAAWVGASCDSAADCEGLGCGGAETCLLPGETYPEGCVVAGLMTCFYAEEGFGGRCDALCEGP